MRKRIRTNFDLCTGCGICLLACSEKNKGGYNPRFAMLRIEKKQDGLVEEPIVCNQCENPYCLQVCPANAITKDPESGIVKINKQKCTGCGLCKEYCPRDVIVIKDGIASKCELCEGDPVCVKSCPTNALELIKVGENYE